MSAEGRIQPLEAVDGLSLTRELVALNRQLSLVVAHGGSPSELIDLLAEQLQTTIWIMGETAEIIGKAFAGVPKSQLAGSRPDVLPPMISASILRLASETGSALRCPEGDHHGPLLVAPVYVDATAGAFLVALEPRDRASDDLRLLALEQAATICGMMLGRERLLLSATARVQDGLVEGLLLGHTTDRDELMRWATYLGINLDIAYRLILFSTAPEDTRSPRTAENGTRIYQIIRHFCESRCAGVFVVHTGDEITVLVPADRSEGSDLTVLASDCLEYSRELFADSQILAVLSRPCSNPADIAPAYREALRTTRALCRLGWRTRVASVEELGVLQLLLKLPELEELRQFSEEALGVLVRYDEVHGTELIPTLAAYFKTNGSLRQMTQSLHVHPNTIGYRLKRSAELAQFDLDSYRDRLTIQVAIEILDLVGLRK